MPAQTLPAPQNVLQLQASGTVEVLWTKQDGGALMINWIERGGLPVEPPKGRGFGMRVIDEVVGRQLRGQARFDWAPGGLSCRIELPDFFKAPI